MTQDPVHALAEVWASIDGKLERFQRDHVMRMAGKEIMDTDGHYDGYIAEAEEAIERLRARGFDVLPIATSVTPFRPSATKEHNKMLVQRIIGVQAQPGTPETDADPRNPNAAGPAPNGGRLP